MCAEMPENDTKNALNTPMLEFSQSALLGVRSLCARLLMEEIATWRRPTCHCLSIKYVNREERGTTLCRL
jgi:hypothetical protein